MLGSLPLGGCTWLRKIGILPPYLGPDYATAFACDLYNRLPTVELAYAALIRTPRYQDHLRDGLRILAGARAGRTSGLVLLHRHFNCRPQGLMVEQIARRDGEQLYVTAPTDGLGSRNIAPSRFAVRLGADGKPYILPWEFSADPRVLAGFERIATDEETLAKLARYFDGSPVGLLLGVAVTDRRFRERGTLAYELTYTDPPESLVRYLRNLEFDPNRALPTIWSARELDGCCSVGTYCEGWCDVPIGGEPGDHGHWHIQHSTGHVGCV